MTSYFITGASGFIGRRVLDRLLAVDPDAEIHALVRESSMASFTAMLEVLDLSARVTPVTGDLTAPGLGVDAGALPAFDHVIHLAAIYDMAADAESQRAANVIGTSRVADFAIAHGALLHHVSSIAVAGDHRGRFTEMDFAVGQGFPTPYHRTKFEAERVVREREGLRWRVYRPSIVVGDSRTGEMDKIDGPYYFFGHLGMLGRLPSMLRLPMPDLGTLNIVPVDYVVDAMVALLTVNPTRSGLVFHLSAPHSLTTTEMYNALAPAFDAPKGFNAIPHTTVEPLIALSGKGPARIGRNLVAAQQGIPSAVLDAMTMPVDFRADTTIAVLHDFGISVPDFADYAPRLWTYWSRHLDRSRNRRADPRGPLVGKNILITGGSSGIGKATARMCVARGANVIIVARSADELDSAAAELNSTTSKQGIPPGRVVAYRCDITDEESVNALVKSVLGEHGHVDVLVNNAGRSIRRATMNSVQRPHDYHRVMAVNYFGAVNLILGLLPHMVVRQAGHVVNVTSIAVQSRGPRFGAYAASKAALEAFSDVTGTETVSDHVTFTNVRLPLVKTRMISPTEIYDNSPATWDVDKAASRVLHAIVDRPKHVDSIVGTIAELGHRFVPGLTTRILHQEYLLFGESAAAMGRGTRVARKSAT
ncbi:SDR family oxidoreductase [Gordonia jinghuaiqii]|uniref:SDR family oxidoreductase n=1 Tax=Gordonia jinghuaiqii TaxID=2758710 RepID=A0A7D7LV54_9ACTN|nr:SDR family oxidoreductase [Gordonia jinghuaiqii]MCR5979915.1 SDR family oxidoreductase [Gordonia jinghuaiqii]QMT03117.1 SDR family oxidoreductase [Gordonia jinghuaiqii]